MKKLVFIPLFLLLISGCLYKSVKSDEADNILKARVYTGEGKNYLVMMEAVFQTKYKESRQGFSITSGFNELRISVYNLEDGSLVARKPTGKQITSPIVFLGSTEGNLWFYSLADRIHSLDPDNLEMRISQETIFEKNPELKDNMAECEWYQIPQYFQFNEITGNIVLTDKLGYRYALNTETLKAEKIEGEYRSFDPREDQNMVTSVSFPPPTLMITGDLRKQVKVDGKAINADLTFLDGKMIADRNPRRNSESLRHLLSEAMMQAEDINPRILALNEMNNGRGPLWGTPQRDTLRKLEETKNKLERYRKELEECKTDIETDGYSHKFTQLLSPDASDFFVFHKVSTSKDARLAISRVSRKGSSELTELWNTGIEGLFFDPSDASETNEFKKVFSKGSPEFTFSYFDLSGNKLIIIWMLHTYCIDVNTGQVLWHFRV